MRRALSGRRVQWTTAPGTVMDGPHDMPRTGAVRPRPWEAPLPKRCLCAPHRVPVLVVPPPRPPSKAGARPTRRGTRGPFTCRHLEQSGHDQWVVLKSEKLMFVLSDSTAVGGGGGLRGGTVRICLCSCLGRGRTQTQWPMGAVTHGPLALNSTRGQRFQFPAGVTRRARVTFLPGWGRRARVTFLPGWGRRARVTFLPGWGRRARVTFLPGWGRRAARQEWRVGMGGGGVALTAKGAATLHHPHGPSCVQRRVVHGRRVAGARGGLWCR